MTTPTDPGAPNGPARPHETPARPHETPAGPHETSADPLGRPAGPHDTPADPPDRHGSPANPLTAVLIDLLPMLERIRRLTPAGVVRLRIDADRVVALAALPVGVLAGRTLAIAGGDEEPADVTVGVADLIDVLAAVADRAANGDGPLALPPRRDAEWRYTPPPRDGWQRVAELADADVRAAVRAAAMAVAAAPMPAAADLALDARAFPNSDTAAVAALDRRGPSGLVKMGFCPRGGVVAVDVAARWTRLVGGYGSVYLNGGDPAAGSGGINLLTMLG